MLISVTLAHDDIHHVPKLYVNNPDSFQITNVIRKPSSLDTATGLCLNPYAEIYFSYEGTDYMVTDNNSGFLSSLDLLDSMITLYQKAKDEYIKLDSVVDSRTDLSSIGNQKFKLINRLTDIRLIGGYAEQTVEQIHKEIKRVEKEYEERLKALRNKLY